MKERTQIDILADYILKEFWYEISLDESAVDVAIKIMGKYKELIINNETLELNKM